MNSFCAKIRWTFSRWTSRRLRRWTVGLGLLLCLSAPARAEVQTFLHAVDQPFAGSQSPDDARIAALAKAKHEVLEKAGTYLESLTIVQNYNLTRDDTIALAAGILKTEIVSQENYARPGRFGLILKTKIDVDTTLLDSRIQGLVEDRALLEKYRETQQREAGLLAQIKRLEARNRTLQASQSGVDNQAQQEVDRQFKEIVQVLPALEWNRKAIGLWRQGKYTDPVQALEYLDRAIEIDPQNALAYNNRGVAHFNQTRYNVAIGDYSKALALDPDYADAFHNRGVAHYELAQYENAVADFNEVIRLTPKRAEAFLNRGLAYKKTWRLKEAMADYNHALQLNPALETPSGSTDSAAIELKQMENLCEKAQRACKLGLCKSLNELQQRGFCGGLPPAAKTQAALAADPAGVTTISTVSGRLQSLRVKAQPKGLRLDLTADRAFDNVHLFGLPLENRIVVDVYGRWKKWREIKWRYPAEHPQIKQVRTGSHPNFFRIVVDLDTPVDVWRTQVDTDAQTLKIQLVRRP